MKIFNPQNSESFVLHEHKKEVDFEKVVVQLSSQVFGDESIYFDIKKKIRNGDVATIPDGYLLDLVDPQNPSLYVVENEIVSHDAFKHIGIQLLKFATSFDSSHAEIKKFLMNELQSNAELMKKFNLACEQSKSRNIDFFLESIINQGFKALVIIDEATDELYNVIGKINADISVIELKTFVNAKGEFLYEFNTLYDEDDFEYDSDSSKAKVLTTAERKAQLERKALCDTIIVPARKDGFDKVFIGENRWYAISIGAAMKDKIKWIAAYQKAPISAITHLAQVKEIKSYKNSDKYEVVFQGPVIELKSPLKLINPNLAPQRPVYGKKIILDNASSVDDVVRK